MWEEGLAMLSAAPIVLGAAALGEAKSYLRIVSSDEDALVARLMAGAAELCEQFTGQTLVARSFTETLAASAAWTRLGATPVRAIIALEAVPPPPQAAYAVAAGGWASDIDANGDGWVRVMDAGAAAARIRASYQAGLAADWTGLPEALRQGIVRLAAHLYTHRDDEGAPPPAAVTALWRPWRRMRLR